jgi:lipoic acid synthetase
MEGVREKKPSWLKVRLDCGSSFMRTRRILAHTGIATVCEEARCPNKSGCWGDGTATFLLMGRTCTRRCGFCAVRTAPRGEPLNPEEPRRIAEAVRELGLRYAVLTSVTRDDLPDCGAEHMARCVGAIKEVGSMVEVLLPDLRGCLKALRKVVDAKPEVVGHNLETVRRLQSRVRDGRASYDTSLTLLRTVKELDSSVLTKSALILGFGEREEEVVEAMRDLREADVDLLTLGQYLRPSSRHLPVKEYVTPAKFHMYKKKALEMGFRGVASDPMVRSSYMAASMLMEVMS